MVLTMKNFNILGIHWKIRLLGGGLTKPIENCLKEGGGAWTVYRFKRGLGKKEGGGVFEGGDTPMHALYITLLLVGA